MILAINFKVLNLNFGMLELITKIKTVWGPAPDGILSRIRIGSTRQLAHSPVLELGLELGILGLAP